MSKEIISVPTQDEFQVYQVMAKKASESKFFSSLNGEAGILSIMLMARELGLPPMQSIMGGMNIIQGKVEISPRMMNTMIRKAGHKLEILESTDQVCKIKGTRSDTKEEYTVTFTIDDARRAGLVRGGGGWEKYASDMLFARCISRLSRRLFADVISTAYVEGEINEEPTEKVEEAIVVQNQSNGIEFITADEVAQIEENISEDDKEYRENLLSYFSNKCGTLKDFSQLPKREFKPLMNSIMKRRKKKIEMEQPQESAPQPVEGA
jgi:hypothetical protein